MKLLLNSYKHYIRDRKTRTRIALSQLLYNIYKIRIKARQSKLLGKSIFESGIKSNAENEDFIRIGLGLAISFV